MTVEDQAEGDTGILNTWCFDYTVAPDPDVPASGNPAAVALAVLMLALLGTRVLRRT